MTSHDHEGFAAVDPREFATGWVAGHLQEDPTGATALPVDPGPIEAMERVLLPALLTPPCVIGFSGGRDSSAILAVAVRLARREGLEEPIPFTQRFPGIPGADESAWQEMVVRWVGCSEWDRKEFVDELDLLSPHAQASVVRHGPLWPATVHNRAPMIARARGGWYVDGEGGDEVLGDMRITPLRRFLDEPRVRDVRTVKVLLRTLAPARLRQMVSMRRLDLSQTDRTWVRPDVQRWYETSWVIDESTEPLPFRAGLQRLRRRRAVAVAIQNLDRMGRELDVRYLHPFLDPGFLEALGHAAGRLGFRSRTAAMRAIFGDLLPDAVNARGDKAVFNGPFIGPQSREFIDSWNGDGVDEELVDPRALRSVWDQEVVHGGTFQLLHAAWLAQQGPIGPASQDASGRACCRPGVEPEETD